MISPHHFPSRCGPNKRTITHSQLKQTMPRYSPRSLPLRSLFSRLLQHSPLSTSASRLTDAGPLASRLSSRAVLRFSGPDTAKYLQNLLTNDILPLTQSPPQASDDTDRASYISTPNVALYRPPPVYAALLTPQGRFLYDLFLYRPPPVEEMLDRSGSGPMKEESDREVTLLADVDNEFVDEILSTLKRYRLRSKVEIENASDDFSCWQRFGGGVSNANPSSEEPEASSIGWGTGVDRAAESSAQGTEHGWQWFTDPRLDSLGFRGIFPSNTTPPLVEADKETDEWNYVLWRLMIGIAEGSSEIPKGEAIPLEYNFAGLNAISFDKGCYVGQELIARTHHRGVIRKRLTPFRLVDANGEEVEEATSPGSEIMDDESGKKIGTVNKVLGSKGIGLLKIEEAFKPATRLILKNIEDLKIEVIRPDWWPAEWIQVHDQQHVAAST
ncbi:hypothetical protein LUZ61_020318 [Rhynchospora tenuis]|uniref:CAF17 C-terminal domain-containing protein n=1 Tax=Rhynchospora tenuis TaxID=198213 RepID=A0AAD5ZD74_9POAL|nr:hypothetical protein LUZ61_020318 [Rhynchospora tenuis]